jgi:hypothetical protein
VVAWEVANQGSDLYGRAVFPTKLGVRASPGRLIHPRGEVAPQAGRTDEDWAPSLAPKDDDKAFWLRLAEDRLRLLGLVEGRT